MLLRKKRIILISIVLLIPITSKYETEYQNHLEKIEIEKYLNNNESPYLMVIDIPKIKLYKGIYNYKAQENDISKNIEILKYSNLGNNTIFLASHSGTSSNAYFNDIVRLSINDNIYIYYKKKRYTYIVSNIYYIEKTGYLKLHNNLENKLILITCSLNYNNKQIIVESILNSIEMSENVK